MIYRENVNLEKIDFGSYSAWTPFKETFHHTFSVEYLHLISDSRLVPTNKEFSRFTREGKWAKYQRSSNIYDSTCLTLKESMTYLTPMLEKADFKSMFSKNMEYHSEMNKNNFRPS